MSKVAELWQYPETCISCKSRQETGPDVTKIVRRWFQASPSQPPHVLRKTSDSPWGMKLRVCSYRGQEAFVQPPEAQGVTSRPPWAGKSCTGQAEVFPHGSLAIRNAKGHPEMGVEENGREAENGRKSDHWSRKPHLVKTSDQSKIKELGGQLLRSKGVSWSRNSDKQEST